MSQKEDVSAMLDGELEAEEVRFLLKNLNREGVEAWQSYTLVSDALQASDVAVQHKPLLLVNIAHALEQEPTIVSNQLRTRISRKQFWSGLTSVSSKRVVAMAAGIAFCALMLQVFVPPSSPDMVLAKQSELPSTQMAVLDESSLTYWQEYLLAHHQHSPGVGASAVVSMVRSEVPVSEVSVVDGLPQQTPSNHLASDLKWMNVWDDAPNVDGPHGKSDQLKSLQGGTPLQPKQYSGF